MLLFFHYLKSKVRLPFIPEEKESLPSGRFGGAKSHSPNPFEDMSKSTSGLSL